ncbi:Sodium-dependent nutrient amino acid transporter 1 [Trachymyrmex septentrionalis]|uniref:Sodium-dependent nutrient amino acid transporter 1 n=1 Tax=Trachymyrmex septentrionalis TaxID=34720 RepID=A0A151K030_9HYME|nr:Sodium-dependent nutrient amino acid transporter 1 [Trachymyrmex septentrionalis]
MKNLILHNIYCYNNNNNFTNNLIYFLSTVVGWILFSIAVLQIPLWIVIAIFKKRFLPFRKMISQAFQPSKSWGPSKVEDRRKWLAFRDECDVEEK